MRSYKKRIAALEKKFSVGVSLAMSAAEFKSILDEFEYYIYDIYFSPPAGDKFHTRKSVADDFKSADANIRLFEVLDHAVKLGIRIELALNSPMLDENSVLRCAPVIRERIHVDSIVTLNRFADITEELFPEAKKVYSYNNELRTKGDIDRADRSFEEIVMGNSTLRRTDLFTYAKARGFKVKLMVNNGCSFNCLWCSHSEFCHRVFRHNLERYSAEQLYAMQSIFPGELHEHLLRETSIDHFKISSRSASTNYDILHNCLESYIDNNDRALIEKSPKYYYLWCRLGHFGTYYSLFDFDSIIAFKRRLWDGYEPELEDMNTVFSKTQ